MTRKVLVSGMAMVLMAVSATLYLTYGVFGYKLGAKNFSMTVVLPTSGGLMDTSPVTLNGLQIGKVTSLAKTEGGITAELEVDAAYQIPMDSAVSVANLSAVGEQYIDFAPKTSAGPYFSDGSIVPTDKVVQPLTIARALGGVQGVMHQIDPDSINRILSGTDIAIEDVGPNIQRLVSSGSMFATTLRQNRELVQRLVGFLAGASTEASEDQMVLLRSSVDRLARTLAPELPVLLDQMISIVETSGGTEVVPFIGLALRLWEYFGDFLDKGGVAMEVIRPYVIDPIANNEHDLGKVMDGLLAAFPDGKGFRLLVDLPH